MIYGSLGAEQLPGTANYFIGNDPSKWHSNVPTYAKVKYAGVYPGVDLVYYGSQRQLEYDFVVAPGADPKSVRLHFAGAKRLKLDSNGDLQVTARNGEIAFHKPIVYQVVDGLRQSAAGRFTLLAKNAVGFAVDSYDHNRELVIDPVLEYSTYLGGSGGGEGQGIAVDAAGDAYLTGTTTSADFPVTSGAFQTMNNGGDVFITKLNPEGTRLIYSTYLGGSGDGQEAGGIAVDAAGNAYVGGSTFSTDFPVTSGAFQTVNNAANGLSVNAFITKLNPAGTELIYSTYLGGSFFDYGYAIAVDAAGDAFLTGESASFDFPVTSGAFQTMNPGGDAFVTKLNPEGTGLIYSTFVGGGQGYGIAVDATGSAYVTGGAGVSDFPVTSGAFQTVDNANPSVGYNAFITKFNPEGTALIYSTYLGGDYTDIGYGIAVDAAGDAYVTGTAFSSDFPVTSGAIQTVNNAAAAGHANAFIAQLNPAGAELIFSTYLGGSFADGGSGIAVDATGSAYVTGGALSSDFPVTSGAFQMMNKLPRRG